MWPVPVNYDSEQASRATTQQCFLLSVQQLCTVHVIQIVRDRATDRHTSPLCGYYRNKQKQKLEATEQQCRHQYGLQATATIIMLKPMAS